MKNNVLFILISLVSLLSCEGLLITDEILKDEKATSGTPKSELVLVENENYLLIEKDFGVGKNYFFRSVSGEETFLFLTCNWDCGEKLEVFLRSADQNYFAFLTKNSSRIKSGNRLILYQVIDNKPVELLDTVKEVYKTFRFEGKKFIYTLQDGTERSIELK